MQTTAIPISKLESNPWYFRIFSKKDFELLVEQIELNGISSITLPVVAVINNHFYIVDGHSRVQAAKKVGLKTIPCKIVDWVKNYRDLRIWSFKLNRHGYSNPLTLSEMINEDIKIDDNVESVADSYGVTKDYVLTLMKINKLHEDAKAIIQKIFSIASKKYQLLLDQITPAHISYLSDLDHDKQIEVVNWIFHDVMYGPAIESQVSLPSILEIMNEIEKINNGDLSKSSRKNKQSHKNVVTNIPFRCRCGLEYEIDFKKTKVYEYLDLNNIHVKKEFVQTIEGVRTYSSNDYDISELKKVINNNWKDSEIRITVTKGERNEDWK